MPEDINTTPNQKREKPNKEVFPWEELRKDAREFKDQSFFRTQEGDQAGAQQLLYKAGEANEKAFDLTSDPKYKLTKVLIGLDATLDFYNSMHLIEANRMSTKALEIVNETDNPDAFKMLTWIKNATQPQNPSQ